MYLEYQITIFFIGISMFFKELGYFELSTRQLSSCFQSHNFNKNKCAIQYTEFLA